MEQFIEALDNQSINQYYIWHIMLLWLIYYDIGEAKTEQKKASKSWSVIFDTHFLTYFFYKFQKYIQVSV